MLANERELFRLSGYMVPIHHCLPATDEVASRAVAVQAGKGAFIIYIKYNVFGSYMATRVL